MNNISLKEAVQLLDKLQYLIDSINTEVEKIDNIFPNFFTCPLMEVVWTQQAILINLIADKVNIDIDTLGWWVNECNFGEKELSCSYPGEESVILKNNKEFIEFEWRDRK